MRAKPIVLLVVALGCGMVAAVAASKAVMDDSSGGAGQETVEIFVAVKDLPHAKIISAENVKLDKWPRARVPEGALTKLDQLEGKFTNQGIFAGEPILTRKLSNSRESFSTGIPPGFGIFNLAGNSSNYIKPGDRVDILGTFQLGSGQQATRESRTVIKSVTVYGINGITVRDSDEINAARDLTFQLLVPDAQLEPLELASSMGDLKLILRRLDGDDEGEGKTDDSESFLTWLSEQSNPKEPPPALFTANISRDSDQADLQDAGDVEPAHEMVIITPDGMSRYQWMDINSLPVEVNSARSNRVKLGGQNASGNVSSDYGGYPPTYPSSTDDAPAADDQAPAPVKPEPGVIQRRR